MQQRSNEKRCEVCGKQDEGGFLAVARTQGDDNDIKEKRSEGKESGEPNIGGRRKSGAGVGGTRNDYFALGDIL